MKVVERTLYLDRLLALADVPDIKVITGIRRSGKSMLLDALAKRLKSERGNANLIRVSYGDKSAEELLHADKLYDYVAGHYQKNKQNFVLIDEVQMCPDFERAVSWLHNDMKYSLYITGSNAFLLSSDLATLFTGRTFEIEIYPFSFAEYLSYYGCSDLTPALRDYVLEGGMAGSYVYPTIEEKYQYLAGVYETLIIRDILERFQVKNEPLLRDIGNFLLDNIGNITSAHSLVNCLPSKTTDNKTVVNYIRYLTEAFAFYPVRRYDVQGKEYLRTREKYYLADHAFRYALHSTKNLDFGRALENIVAIELRRRGYRIYAGAFRDDREVDFVAMNRHGKVYIQVADDVANPETLEREVGSLLKIRDGYPRFVLANIGPNAGERDGVQVVDLAEWLAGKVKV